MAGFSLGFDGIVGIPIRGGFGMSRSNATPALGVWILTNPLNTARASLAGCGSSSAALSFGGGAEDGSAVDTTERYFIPVTP